MAMVTECLHRCMAAIDYRGPMTSYTPPLNIANIGIIDLLPATPPQYLMIPVNIYEFLLPPLLSTNPHYPLLILLPH